MLPRSRQHFLCFRPLPQGHGSFGPVLVRRFRRTPVSNWASSPARAAEFSFLVGLPTLAGAAVYKGTKAGPAMIAVFGWPHVIVGTLVAAVSAALAVRFLVHYLTRHGLGVFAVYRLLLAGLLAWVFLR